MWYLVHRFLKVTSKDSDVDDTSSRYLIFDDTTLPKTGKRMEKIGKVWDHVTNRYVLVDSWFTCDALIQAIRSVKDKEVHLIGMYKFAKTRFAYQGKSLTHAQINNMLGKPIRCRSLGYQYKQAKVLYQGTEISLFFSRRGKSDNWKVLLTTDTTLTFKRLIEHYQVRWVVEVFNRESKQLLNLGGCQSSNFDAQIAETTISMIAYLLLTLRLRYDNYESKGALYRSMNAEILRETLDKRLWGLFIELVNEVCEVLEMDAEDLLEKMLTNPKAESMIIALCCSVMVKDD